MLNERQSLERILPLVDSARRVVGRVTPCAPLVVLPAFGAHGVTRPTGARLQGSKREAGFRRILPLLILLAFSGCATRTPEATAVPTHDEIRERALAVFDWAQLFKPAEVVEDPLAGTFAPLLFLEVSTNAPAAPDVTGQVGGLEQGDGSWRLATSPPSVYFRANPVFLAGRWHPQITFLWFHPPEKERIGLAARVRAVRITLDSDGRPVIWEALRNPDDRQVIFVAQSLETRAAEEFGPPLPGRRYSIERHLREKPGTVVARVIEDAPVPMGPIVHLRAGTFEVSALLCRCMSPQVRHLTGTTEYRLQPMDEVMPFLRGTDRREWAFQLAGSDDQELEHALRLPSVF